MFFYLWANQAYYRRASIGVNSKSKEAIWGPEGLVVELPIEPYDSHLSVGFHQMFHPFKENEQFLFNDLVNVYD